MLQAEIIHQVLDDQSLLKVSVYPVDAQSPQKVPVSYTGICILWLGPSQSTHIASAESMPHALVPTGPCEINDKQEE